MKVLHVISSIDPTYGGPTTALIGLIEAQLQMGVEVSVLATSTHERPSLVVAERLRQSGAEVRVVGPATGPLLRHPHLLPAIEEMVGQSNVVHLHGLWEELQHQSSRVAYSNHTPYIFRPCGMLAPWDMERGRRKKQLYMAWRLRRNLDQASAIHFTTEEERDLVEPLGFKSPSIVEPNGVALEDFASLPPKGSFRAQHKALRDSRIVLFLGRLHQKKGLDLLIPAFATATKVDNGDAMLVIAGPDDGYKAEAEASVASLGIQDRVLFVGMLQRSECIAALVDADLFALPSYHENFGNAVVEALAAGTPVIISDKVNIHKQISSAEVGAVVPTKVEPLAQELARWLGESSLCESAGVRATQFVQEQYSWPQIAQRWESHYNQMRK